MRNAYNEIEPEQQDYLRTDDGHEIYYEVSGNPEGIPVVFLHGGPGSGAKPHHRQYFDPERYRIVIFDQRGSGRSRPKGKLEANTTAHLIQDMETIRQRLGIEQWLVFGGSWGATLALLYAEQHPQQVIGMVLRGTFLARARDYQWLLGRGAERFFPDYWQEFEQALGDLADNLNQPAPQQPDAIIHLLDRALNSDERSHAVAAAEAWAWWTGRVVTYTLTDNFSLDGMESDDLIKSGGIELHYARHAYFIEENQILANSNRLPAVPVRIIHGRRDMICAPAASWSVHQALPQSEMIILPEAGHLGGETPMVEALVNAADAMADKLATR